MGDALMGVPRTPWRVIVLVVVAGLGVCLMFVAGAASSLLDPLPAWPAFAVGFVAVGGALAGLWRFERRRDRTLG